MRCPTHLSIGQEAVPAVMSLHVRDADYAVSTHRGHAHYLSKGGCLKSMIAEIYGKETGCSKGKGGSMHLTDPSVNFIGTTAIVGGSIPIGVGAQLVVCKIDQQTGSFNSLPWGGRNRRGRLLRMCEFFCIEKPFQ